jgi:capsular polysaccharide biosynthesis protein
VSNEVEVREFFMRKGWALIAPEKLSIPDQIALFRDAEAIAGVHGSAFTNLVWSSPGARVLELVPENFLAGAFEWLARANGLRHDFLVCEADYQSNIQVDLSELNEAL